MKITRTTGAQVLQRAMAAPEESGPDPLEPFYAGLGLLGVLYESMLLYFKNELEKPGLVPRDERLVANLQAVHAAAVNLLAAKFSGRGLEWPALRDLLRVNGEILRDLANEGRGLMLAIEDETMGDP